MGILSHPLSRGAALFGLAAVGIAVSGSVPTRQGLPLQASKFAYLLGVSLTVGISTWTTFIFGIVAFKTLPRQTFGLLQAKLFPKYFQVLTISLAIMLLTFTTAGAQKQSAQLWTLVVALTCNIGNLLYIEPVATATMFEKHKLERATASDATASDATASNGQNPSPELKKLGKKFGKLHGISSLLNLVTLGAAYAHLWNLAAALV